MAHLALIIILADNVGAGVAGGDVDIAVRNGDRRHILDSLYYKKITFTYNTRLGLRCQVRIQKDPWQYNYGRIGR